MPGHAAMTHDSCWLLYSPTRWGTKGFVPFCVISPAIAGLYVRVLHDRGSGDGSVA